MKPSLWRALVIACGIAILVLTAVDTVSLAFSNAEDGWKAARTATSTDFRVRSVTDPAAIAGPIAPGDVVHLRDGSYANRIRYLRQRPGDSFTFEGRSRSGRPVSWTSTFRPHRSDRVLWLYELMRVAFVLVAMFVALRAPGDPAARALVALFVDVALLPQALDPVFPLWLCMLIALTAPVFQVGSGYTGLLVATEFPQPSTTGWRRRLARANPPVTAFALLSAAAFTACVVAGRMPPKPVLTAWQISAGATNLFYFGGITLAFVISTRTAAGADRKRARWVAYTTALGFTGPVATLVIAFGQTLFGLPPVGPWVSYLALTLLVIPFGLGYAIVRHRVVDIGFVVNRALVFGALSAIVVVTFMVLEWALSSVFVKVSHITSTTLELGLALVLGFSLRTIHAKVDRFVDDVFFRDRHEAEGALRAFAHEVAFITDPQLAVARTHAELTRHSGTPACAVYVVDGAVALRIDPGETAAPERVGIDDPALVRLRATRCSLELAGVRSDLAGERVFPMLVRDTLTGAVVLGSKSNGEAYAPDELASVETVVRALGNALDALQTAALKAEIARVLLDGAPLDALRRTVDAAGWVRGAAPQPTGRLGSLTE
jgi:hypothetical protein